MKNVIYWIIVGFVLTAGLAATIYFGLEPKTVTKITLTQFADANVLADSILSQLRDELGQYPVVLLGIEPEEPGQMQIWDHFMKVVPVKFDHVIADQFLKIENSDFAGAERTDTKDNLTALLEALKKAEAQGQKVLILLPTVYSSQLIPGNVASILKDQGHLKVLSLTLADFPRNREEEKYMRFPCSVEDVDQTGLGKLGCTITQEARANYHNLKAKGAWIGLMDQVSDSDFLILATHER